MTDIISLDSENLFHGTVIQTQNASILLIQGKKANLGCGYFTVAAADRLKDRFAIVTGVKNYDDMLKAIVVSASIEAKACGVESGKTTGYEALLLMEKD